MSIKFILLFLLLLLGLVSGLRGGRYSLQEQKALRKLKELVEHELYEDYMHRDEYLIPWLRNRNLDVIKAAEFVRANLKWRKQEKMDEALHETFPQFEKDYAVDLKTRDREGRPVVLLPYSSWDTRAAASSGQIKQLVRYLVVNVFERGQVLARQEGITSGTYSTQIVVITDVDGYNLQQHACIECFEFYLRAIQTYEAHYPQLMSNDVVINTPPIFDQILGLIRPYISEQFNDTLNLLGPFEEWKRYLDLIIDPKQLPRRYGGRNAKCL